MAAGDDVERIALPDGDRRAAVPGPAAGRRRHRAGDVVATARTEAPRPCEPPAVPPLTTVCGWLTCGSGCDTTRVVGARWATEPVVTSCCCFGGWGLPA